MRGGMIRLGAPGQPDRCIRAFSSPSGENRTQRARAPGRQPKKMRGRAGIEWEIQFLAAPPWPAQVKADPRQQLPKPAATRRNDGKERKPPSKQSKSSPRVATPTRRLRLQQEGERVLQRRIPGAFCPAPLLILLNDKNLRSDSANHHHPKPPFLLASV